MPRTEDANTARESRGSLRRTKFQELKRKTESQVASLATDSAAFEIRGSWPYAVNYQCWENKRMFGHSAI